MLAVLLSGNENESFNYNNDNVDYERLWIENKLFSKSTLFSTRCSNRNSPIEKVVLEHPRSILNMFISF